MKVINCIPCLQEWRWALIQLICPHQPPLCHQQNPYLLLKRLLITSVETASWNSIYFDPLCPLLVLTLSTHKINEVLNNKLITRAIAQDISKAFDMIWHRGCYKNSPAMTSLEEYSPCLERLLRLKWSSYIRSIAKYTGKMIGSRNYLTPLEMFSLKVSNRTKHWRITTIWSCPILNLQSCGLVCG